VIPVSYKGIVGGYYAFCYLDTDDGLALGREPFGYPKKYARTHIQQTGRAATASMVRKDAAINISVVLDATNREVPPVKRYPHLLLQVLPSAESTDVLLKRVILRDTGAVSDMRVTTGDAAIEVPVTPLPNELEWLSGTIPVCGLYSRGPFRSALGKVLDTIEIGRELRALAPAET
jgi:acetoacetate decarboxylase